MHSHHGSHGSLGSPFGWGSICAYLRLKEFEWGKFALGEGRSGCTREKKECLQGVPPAAYLSKGSESTMSGSMSDPMLQSAVVLRYPSMACGKYGKISTAREKAWGANRRLSLGKGLAGPL